MHGSSKDFVIVIKHDCKGEPIFKGLTSKGYANIKDKYLTTQELYDIYLEALRKGLSFPDSLFIEDWLAKNKPLVSSGVKVAASLLFQIAYKVLSEYRVFISEMRPTSSVATSFGSNLLNTLAITFDRINSKGIRIELFDIAVAAFYKYGISIRKRFEKLQDHLDRGYKAGSLRIPFLGSGKGIRGEDILRTMALILRVTVKKGGILGGIDEKVQLVTEGRTVTTIGGITIKAAAAFSDVWNYTEESYIKALERLRERYGVYSLDPSKQKSSMPYSSMLPVLAAFLHVAQHHPNAAAHRDCVEAMIDFWYWISVFAERYSSSADTTSETDVSQFRSWVENLGTKSARPPNFFWDHYGETISIDLAKTKQTQAVFRAVLNIIYMDGALDWSDDGVTIPKLKDLPPEVLNQDHIFPKDLLRHPKHSPLIKRISPEVIENSILNRTLISKIANSKKGAKTLSDVLTYLDALRSSYLPHLSLSEFLEGHLINSDAQKAMADDDIAAFLEHRQRAIIDRIQKLVNDILGCLAKCPHMPSVKVTFKAGSSLQMNLEEQE
jgi:hypothetical protein